MTFSKSYHSVDARSILQNNTFSDCYSLRHIWYHQCAIPQAAALQLLIAKSTCRQQNNVTQCHWRPWSDTTQRHRRPWSDTKKRRRRPWFSLAQLIEILILSGIWSSSTTAQLFSTQIIRYNWAILVPWIKNTVLLNNDTINKVRYFTTFMFPFLNIGS